MIAWGICPYKLGGPIYDQYRYCAMDDFTPQILADGGSWKEAECLGNHAVVKVRASVATLLLIDATPGFIRIPRRQSLADSLSDLTAGEKATIQAKLNALGFSNAEILAKIGNDLGNVTMGQLGRFLVSRWRRPVAIVGGNVIFELTDWHFGSPNTVENIEAAVV